MEISIPWRILYIIITNFYVNNIMCEQKIEEVFQQWLKSPLEEENIVDSIDQVCIKMVQKAFFQGYELGKKHFLISSHEEQMQK